MGSENSFHHAELFLTSSQIDAMQFSKFNSPSVWQNIFGQTFCFCVQLSHCSTIKPKIVFISMQGILYFKTRLKICTGWRNNTRWASSPCRTKLLNLWSNSRLLSRGMLISLFLSLLGLKSKPTTRGHSMKLCCFPSKTGENLMLFSLSDHI